MNVMEDLKAYVDGELSPERRTDIEAAMEQDERLRQELEEIRVLSRLIGDCVIEPEPVGLEQTLRVLDARRPKPLLARIFSNPMRYAWVGVLGAFVVYAVCFPVFAQSKEAAKSALLLKRTESPEFAAKASAAAPSAEELKRDFSPSDGNSATTGGSTGGTNGVVGGRAFQDQDGYYGDATLKGGAGARAKTPAPLPKSTYQGVIDAPHIAEAEKNPLRRSAEKPSSAPLLVLTADLTIEVANVRYAQADATNLTKSFGGYVEQSGLSEQAGEPSAQLTLRVPQPQFENALSKLRKLGKVESESTTGQDVTTQVADDEARLKEMRAAEDSYVKMLRDAHKVSDALEIRDRLSQVRQDIETLDAERKTLRNQATYSTITLSLTQTKEAPKPVAEPGWFDKAWEAASDRAAGMGRWLAEVGMNLLMLAPIWLPIVVGIWWLGRRGRRSR